MPTMTTGELTARAIKVFDLSELILTRCRLAGDSVDNFRSLKPEDYSLTTALLNAVFDTNHTPPSPECWEAACNLAEHRLRIT